MGAHLKAEDARVAVIGLGYVGLPLALAFGRKRPTIGFDTSSKRIKELRCGVDATKEAGADEFEKATQLSFTEDPNTLGDFNTFIVTVPTPIDSNRRPDLTALQSASRTIGAALSVGDVVVYESTVYPGATEEECIPILEQASGLTFNEDFFVGYSPERINPGDREHKLANITKIVSGSTRATAAYLEELYSIVVHAGIHSTSTIAVAEAAKVIENTQRDLNIALVNELALIFERLDIDTAEVLEAARTKWNFLDFRPGLVGGHCIGVDPYYLTHKAQSIGYHPEVILAGRRINDGMGDHIAERVVKLMTKSRINLPEARVLVLGIAFKENCPDIRNTRVIDIVNALKSYHLGVDVYDPWVSADEVRREYGIEMLQKPEYGEYDAIVLAVAHDEFKNGVGSDLKQLCKHKHIIFDVKSALPKRVSSYRL